MDPKKDYWRGRVMKAKSGAIIYIHGFKNRYGEKTGKETDYWFFGRTGVRSVVKPVTS